MQITGAPHAILAQLAVGEVAQALELSRRLIPWSKNEIDQHEAAALFRLASAYNQDDAHFLEIGTAWGYSASVLAQAAPKAQLYTITPSAKHHREAEGRLCYFPNVHCLRFKSWHMLKIWSGPQLDLVFVDGYHGMVVWDLPWWDWLKPGGLMVFHDYSPAGAQRQCVPVYETLTAVRDAFREFDVRVITDRGQGLVGWYRAAGEKLPALDWPRYAWHYDEAVRSWEPGRPEEAE